MRGSFRAGLRDRAGVARADRFVKLALSWSRRSRSMAMRAVQTLVLTASGLVPTKLLILQNCFSDLKNSSIRQRSF